MKTGAGRANLLVPIILLATASVAQQFIDAPNYPEIGHPKTVVAADFNRDGSADLALGNDFGSAAIVIELGNGDGTFRPGQQLGDSSQAAYHLVIGDWNGDGIPDLAAEDEGPGLSVYLGVGDGTFNLGQQYKISAYPDDIATGDLNGDGVEDLVTADSFGSVSVLLGVGDGTFAKPVSYTLPNRTGNNISVGDLNRDGILDVVAAVDSTVHQDEYLEVYLGSGDGSLLPPVEYPIGLSGYTVAIADLNGDGALDLCAANLGTAVLLGRDDGSFAPAQFYNSLLATTLALADINEDGSPDVLESVASYVLPSVSVLQNRGDSTLRLPVYYGTGLGTEGLAVADFNNDSHPDLVTANYDSSNYTVLLNDGKGELATRRSFDGTTSEVTPAIASVAVGYIDRDKNPDVAVTDTTGNRVIVFPGNPDGTFRPGKAFGTGNFPRGVSLADVDGDGWTDIVTVDQGVSGISVLLGNGVGNFKPAVSYRTGLSPDTLVIGDFNNDGAPDVVTGNYTAHGISALLNDGSGAFPNHLDTYTGSRVIAIAAGDFNKDGYLDIATANMNRIQPSFSILFGNGDGTFALRETNYRSSGNSVAIADVNADGNLDLVLLGSQVTVYLGKGDGTFGHSIITETQQFGGPGVLGDFNDDGKLDAAIDEGGTALLLLGNGDGTFQPTQGYPVGSFAAIAAGDLNRDGALDLVTVGGCCMDVLLNTR